MGRVTYLEMADFWPKSSHVNAAPMNRVEDRDTDGILAETP